MAMHGYNNQASIKEWLIQSPWKLKLTSFEATEISMQLYTLICESDLHLLYLTMKELSIQLGSFNDKYQVFRLELNSLGIFQLIDKNDRVIHNFCECSYIRLTHLIKEQDLSEHMLMITLKEYAVSNQLIRWFDLIESKSLACFRKQVVHFLV